MTAPLGQRLSTAAILFTCLVPATRGTAAATYEAILPKDDASTPDALLSNAIVLVGGCSCGDEFAQRDCKESQKKARASMKDATGRTIRVNLPADVIQLGSYDFHRKGFPLSLRGPLASRDLGQGDCAPNQLTCGEDDQSFVLGAIGLEGSPKAEMVVKAQADSDAQPVEWSGFIPVTEDLARDVRSGAAQLQGEITAVVQDFKITTPVDKGAKENKRRLLEALAQKQRQFSREGGERGAEARKILVPRTRCAAAAPTGTPVGFLIVKVVGIRFWRTGAAPDEAYLFSQPHSTLPFRMKDISSVELEAAKAEADKCEAHDGASCLSLARRYGVGKAVVQDAKKAFSFFVQACEDGNGEGCAMASVWASIGQGTPKNDGQACQYAEKGCPTMPKACELQGDCLATGRGGEKNAAKAAELFAKACPQIKSACRKQAELVVAAEPAAAGLDQATTLFDQACRGGDSRSCQELTELVNKGGIEPVNATDLLEGACNGGVATACTKLAAQYGADSAGRDDQKASLFAEKACYAGDPPSCLHLETYVDRASGLIWQRTPGASTGSQSSRYCAALAIAGGGWRVPTEAELQGLAKTAAMVRARGVPEIANTLFWSSSFNGCASGAPEYRVVNLKTGQSQCYAAWSGQNLRCVKSTR